eukprot:TRINITY_DN24382_c0_g1_i2.p1 TRINITY_DN24382_c0_g1~~TRINITY_DN24382_c0_g1_i2.p1  ORF type:complete len:313 (-),score=24.00 TRINITY_DN24382_c0_g1_i2:207-1145(-)
MLRSLVGSEMCIRDRAMSVRSPIVLGVHQSIAFASMNDAVIAIQSCIESARKSEAVSPIMLLFSELFLGGYGSGDRLTSDVFTITVPREGEQEGNYHGSLWLEPIRATCRLHQVGKVFGFSERIIEDDKSLKHYNSAMAVGDDGAILAVYRKVHLWGGYESSHFSPWNDLQRGCFKFHGISCGILICFDVEFPESVRTLRLRGVEVVLVPTALTNSFNARVTVPSRSFENGCVVCYANNAGADPSLQSVQYCGLSVVALPDGSEGCRLPQSSSTTFETCVVDLDGAAIREARERNDYLAARRPELYSNVPTL